jgi:hypothetical protein
LMKWVFQGFGILPCSSPKERKMVHTCIRRGRSRETTKCYVSVTTIPAKEPRKTRKSTKSKPEHNSMNAPLS